MMSFMKPMNNYNRLAAMLVVDVKKTQSIVQGGLLGALFLASPTVIKAQFTFTTNNDGTLNISNYSGNGPVTIPATVNGVPVTSIGDSAFEFGDLTSVTIPDGITTIGNSAFQEVYSLASVTIPGSVTNTGGRAFFDCGALTNVNILNGSTSLGVSEFGGCFNLISVTIPNSVSSISYSAFLNCYSLVNVDIPNRVTSIEIETFEGCSALRSITIPSSVTNISSDAFLGCSSLMSVYFTGDSPTPTNDSSVFAGDNSTVYYLPGTTGWGTTFDGVPTALWFLPTPLILNSEPSFGIYTNRFGFTISWTTNASVVVEACTNLASPMWQPVQTNALSNGVIYFTDPQWTNYAGRYYRLNSQ